MFVNWRRSEHRSGLKAALQPHRSKNFSTDRLKILILKPSSLGDVVQAMPVLRLLKLHLPDSEIYW